MTVLRGAQGGGVHIPEYSADPASPNPGDVWVRRTVSGGSGGGEIRSFLGLGFPYLTADTGGTTTYELSFRTEAGTTVRETLT